MNARQTSPVWPADWDPCAAILGYDANVLGPPVYFAASGDHTIRIQTREDGVSIDQIVLSPVNYAGAAPGTMKNDTVVVGEIGFGRPHGSGGPMPAEP